MTTIMSGEIFNPPDSLDDLDVTRWNPLMCYLCNEKYEEPFILGCYHSLCSRCLSGRDVEGKMTCPLCGLSTQIKDGEDLPPSDRLMKFLVESTGEEKEKCANCDNEFEQMFFCNTCDQPLCEACREDTHRAKMFAKHDIVVLSKRTKEIHRECAIHQEPYILFSTERKTMLCINCFRDMKVESRSYCVDLETAYTQGCKKLDQSMMAIKDLQISVRDAILLLKVLLEEIEHNAEKEKTAVTELYDLLLEKITETKTSLIEKVDRQYQSKDKAFKAELVNLSTLLPTLHTHLVTSAAFCSSANRFEFLDLAYVLMERLKSIIQLQHPLHPSQGSQIITDFKSMFAKCLEPLLFPPPKTTTIITSTSTIGLTGSSLNLSSSSYSGLRTEFPSTVSVNSSPSHTPQYPQRGHAGYNSLRFKLIESKGIFAEHCVEFDTSHKELYSNTEKLKTQIQELQRDLTVRRCLAKMTMVTELDLQIESLQQGLQEHFTKNEQKQILLEKHWEDSVQRIATEQELYQAQLHDIIRLKQETEKLKTILNRMSSFVSSIASVTERIAPKLGKTTKDCEHDTNIAQLFEQINTMNPDSQHRVDAIRTAQEEREILTANRQNPLDEELIKTKGKLKAPSARKEVGRRDSTKRNSREVKENVLDSPKSEEKETIQEKQNGQEKESAKLQKDLNTIENTEIEKKDSTQNVIVNGITEDSIVIDPSTEKKDDVIDKKSEIEAKKLLKLKQKERDEEILTSPTLKQNQKEDCLQKSLVSPNIDEKNKKTEKRDNVQNNKSEIEAKRLPKSKQKEKDEGMLKSPTFKQNQKEDRLQKSLSAPKSEEKNQHTEKKDDVQNTKSEVEVKRLPKTKQKEKDEGMLKSPSLKQNQKEDCLQKSPSSPRSDEKILRNHDAIGSIQIESKLEGKQQRKKRSTFDFNDTECVKTSELNNDLKLEKLLHDDPKLEKLLNDDPKLEKVLEPIDLIKTDDEAFTLPKDFVASTVKGFESHSLQNSPEKVDNPVRRTRRSRKNKQSHRDSLSLLDTNCDNTQKSDIQEVPSDKNTLNETLEDLLNTSTGSSISGEQNGIDQTIESNLFEEDYEHSTKCNQVKSVVRKLSESVQ
ncbi:RING finger protein 207-like isoform X1 [Mytilus californianus]|uniref:RING finger protein 207-like isoform X1 n=1 Tax=Mytilus californianus TaxID=6549 RepID=UPI0022455867|nr:RING finger protein 207-like isoform X1 [Mytilus californianus]